MVYLSRIHMCRIGRRSLTLRRENQRLLLKRLALFPELLFWRLFYGVTLIIELDLFDPQTLFLCDGRIKVNVSEAEFLIWIGLVVFAHGCIKIYDALV